MIVAHELDVVSSEISEEAPTQAGDMVSGTIYETITGFSRNPGYTALCFCYFVKSGVHERISTVRSTRRFIEMLLISPFCQEISYDNSYFIKIAKKRGFKTDLNLKRFLKFSNRISGSSGDNESKIQNHCLIFWFPRDLDSGTYALGNSILSFTEFLSMFECKDSKKILRL